MSPLPGTRLAARSLLRSLLMHRLRAAAAVFAGALCVALTAAVAVVSTAVEDAIEGAPITSAVEADWVVQARSSSGMELSVTRRLRAAAPDAELAPMLAVNTRLARGDHAPLLVVGTTRAAAAFLPAALRGAVRDLAQARQPADDGLAGSLILSRAWATARGLGRGDRIAIEAPGGVTRWRVVALATGPAANGGAVVLGTLSRIATAFDRPGALDLVLASAGPATSRERLRAKLARAAGPAAAVVAPADTAASNVRAFEPIRNLLRLFVAIVVLAAAATLFLSWRVALDDARAQLAGLRLSGARMAHLGGGATAVLALVLAASVALGAPAGILLGAALSGFTRDMVSLSQLSASPELPVVEPLLQALAVTTLAFVCALWASLMTIRRLTVIEAVVGRTTSTRRAALGAALAGAAASLGASALALGFAGGTHPLLLAPLLMLLVCLALLGPLVLGAVVRRRPGFSALAAGRELTFSARRSASLLIVFGLAIALALALGGVAQSLRTGIDGGVRAWTLADLYVQSAPSGDNLLDDKLAPRVARDVASVEGVKRVGYYTYSTVELHRTRIWLWTWGPRAQAPGLARFNVVEGPSGAALWRALDGATAAVSSNFHRLYGTGVGDRIAVPGAREARRLRVVAVIDDLTSPSGLIVVGPRTYDGLTADRRRFQLIADARDGAAIADVQVAIRSMLRGAHPGLVVYDRHAIRERFGALTGGLVQAFVVFSRVMFVLALLIGGATLATSLSVRERSLALTRLAGASAAQVRRQLLIESLALGACAWIIAAPIGLGLTSALMAAVSAQTGLLPAVRPAWWLFALSLPIALAMSMASLLVAGPRRRMPATAAALAEE